MGTTAETGRMGERAAAEFLRRAGYEICALNWRSGRYELDIVACREGVLHFVEVKTRRSGSLTPPEAAATQRKFRALSRAAACYLRTVGWEGEVQFDLAAAEAAALEQELRRMDAEQLRERTQQEAAAEAKTLKQTKADSYEKKGKSLGEWLFGL